MEEKLKEFGEVKIHRKTDDEYWVYITIGFDINVRNVNECIELVMNLAGKGYPLVHKCEVDKDHFFLRLKRK